jgi:oxygen-independent coproporphyrinogen III oxidase
MKHNFSNLLKKYDVPVPRYTSYPTVPAWKTTPTSEDWIFDIKSTLNQKDSSWSMYLHIPFCETLCTFCGCNTIITKDHKKEADYVALILKEFELYLQQVPELSQKPLKHIHLGGGTPTFLAASQLERLLSTIFKSVKKSTENFEASIEVDPRRTTSEQLKTLRELGFNRISLGVQDFNHEVQRLINRVQPFEITKKITDEARALGFESVNFDLIYGLPAQNHEMMLKTLEQTIQLRPDRIAFYSFALVPWIKPAQRLFADSDLPLAEVKRQLYELGRELLLKAGYFDVGMDHFALATDRLLMARENEFLHRNFMGYTDKKTDLLLGLGVSSISESKGMFHQNEKLLPKYLEQLDKESIPTFRGHILTTQDQKARAQILQLMTQYKLKIESEVEFNFLKEKAKDFLQENLITLDRHELRVLQEGRPFLRNICAMFDEHLQLNNEQKLFSKSI